MQERKRDSIVDFLTAKLQALCAEYQEYKQASPFSNLNAPSAEPSFESNQTSPHSHDGNTVRDIVLSRIQGAEEAERLRIAQMNDESTRLRFLQEIKATRALRDTEAQMDRLIEFKILKAWESLKAVRNLQGFSSTSLVIKLILRDTEPEKVSRMLSDIHK
eukprot:jgi/Hompol1/5025/HPOL_000560-RA